MCCAVCVVAKLMPKMIFNCVQHTLGGGGKAGCNIILLIYVADCELPLIKVSCSLLPRAACLPHATYNWGKLVLLATCIILPAIIHAASLANIQLNYEPATWQHIRALSLSLSLSLSLYHFVLLALSTVNSYARCVYCYSFPLALSPFLFQLFFYCRLPFCITRIHFALHFPHAIELRQQRFLCFSSCC